MEVIPQPLDRILKNMALEFTIPLNRSEEIHSSKFLTVSETEALMHAFTNYIRQLKQQRQAEINERSEEAQLAIRAKQLEGDLRFALLATEDVKALRAKTVHLIEELKHEKEKRMVEVKTVEKYAKHVNILEDHIEKMVKLMKVEAGVKIKILEEKRIERKELFALREARTNQDKMILTQKRLINELRESGKMLVDQLKLMDEKYFELREKLEVGRKQQRMAIEKANKQCAELRTKFAMAHGMASLDSFKVDESKLRLLQGEASMSSPSADALEARTPTVGFSDSFEGGFGATKESSKLRPASAPAHKSGKPRTALSMRMAGSASNPLRNSIGGTQEAKELTKEEKFEIALKKINEKEARVNGKKWTREGLHDLISS